MSLPYHRLKFYKQYYETREITEEGTFTVKDPTSQTDGAPEDYGGSKLTVEVVQRIVFSDSGGNLLELRMDDLHEVMDPERKKGIGAEIMDDAGKEVLETIAATGPSTYLTRWRVRYAPSSEETTNKANFVLGLVEDQIEDES